mgnify:CR=1 FL=1
MKKILTAAVFVLLSSSVVYAADMGMDCCKKCDCCDKDSEKTPAPPSE